MKILILNLLIFSLVVSSCCSLCKVETSVEYQIDTIYQYDTIRIHVDTMGIILNSDELRIAYTDLDSLYQLVDLLESNPDTVLDIRYFPVKINSDTLNAETELAKASSWIYNSKLNMTLQNKEYFDYFGDSLIMIIKQKEKEVVTIGNTNKEVKDKMKKWRRIGIIMIVISAVLGFVVIKGYLKK